MSDNKANSNSSSGNASLPRSFSRLIAVQMMFAFYHQDEFLQEGKPVTIKEIDITKQVPFFKSVALNEEEPVRKVNNRIIKDVILNLQDKFDVINEYIQNQIFSEFNHNDLLVNVILQIAVSEMLISDVKIKNIIISQYILIAQSMTNEGDTHFINAILDNVAKKIFEDEGTL